MSNDNNLTIEITCYDMTARELKMNLERQSQGDEKLNLQIIVRPSKYRTLDPAALLAIIGGSSGLLTTLITGLLKISENRKSQTIVIQGKDGARLEIPADTASEKIDELIAQIKKMDAPKIFL